LAHGLPDIANKEKAASRGGLWMLLLIDVDQRE
jgi:hypothetical protein